jgi:hypothetical protein
MFLQMDNCGMTVSFCSLISSCCGFLCFETSKMAPELCSTLFYKITIHYFSVAQSRCRLPGPVDVNPQTKAGQHDGYKQRRGGG